MTMVNNVIAVVNYVIAARPSPRNFMIVDNLGRAGVASAFGLSVPENLTDERLMWRAVNTLVRRHFSYSEARNVPAILELNRAGANKRVDGADNAASQRSVALRSAAPLESVAMSTAEGQQTQEATERSDSATRHHPISYGVDLCLCLETSFGDEQEKSRILASAAGLPSAIVWRMIDRGKLIAEVRVRYILFGTEIRTLDSDYDTGFLRLSDIPKIDFPRLGPRQPSFNSRAVKALKMAFASEWTSTYPKARHIVAIWAVTPIPSDVVINELLAAWEDGSTSLSQDGKRLIIFAPDADGWTTVSNTLESAIHYHSRAGDGLTDRDFSSIVEAVAQDI